MRVVGVDENGMGPRLGPLIATAVTVETARYDRGRLYHLGQSLGIEDSKASVAFGHTALAESITLAVCEQQSGEVPRTADGVLDALSLDSSAQLQRRCPTQSRRQCWGSPTSLPAFGGDVSDGRRVLESLSRRRVGIPHVRTTVACVAALNEAQREGRTRTDVDLAQFERLVLDARSHAPNDLRAICGMVGGIRKYRDKFSHFAADDVALLREVRGRSSYDVRAVGRVAFEVGADGSHFPVAFASVVGKYVRELCTRRQNDFYLGHQPTLQPASGYHDPVTARFVAESAALRQRLRIADDCFERTLRPRPQRSGRA